jgi:hypothetical protein
MGNSQEKEVGSQEGVAHRRRRAKKGWLTEDERVAQKRRMGSSHEKKKWFTREKWRLTGNEGVAHKRAGLSHRRRRGN